MSAAGRAQVRGAGTMIPQMCTVDDLTGGEPCLRIARWCWMPEGEHPVFLCNFHAEPLIEPAPANAAEALQT